MTWRCFANYFVCEDDDDDDIWKV